MYEEKINDIVSQTNDQLDILKVYMKYRITFWTERVYNRIKVLASVGDFPGTLEFNDVGPVKFDVPLKAYNDGLCKESVVALMMFVIDELNKDIIKLT